MDNINTKVDHVGSILKRAMSLESRIKFIYAESRPEASIRRYIGFIETALNELKIVNDTDIYIDNTEKLSARSYATLVITPKISLKKQKQLVSKFNEFLEKYRERYNSLFLTNYRESNTIARKRISFKLSFDIVNHILHKGSF